MRKKGKYVHSKKIKWMYIGYAGILVLSVVINELFLTTKANGETGNSVEMRTKPLNLMLKALNGNLSKSDSKYIAKKWNFPYEDKRLYIKLMNDENNSENVVVERKTKNDGNIEAAYYQTPVGIGMVDVTKKIKPISLKLLDNRLTLTKQHQVNITFSASENEFTITQFNGEGWTDQSPHNYAGPGLLYIKIPHDLELVDESHLYIQYVGM